MSKFLVLTIAACLSLLVMAGHAAAAPSDVGLNWGTEVDPGECPNGQLVINVSYKVIGGEDSAVGGGVWALEDYVKQIQVWDLGDDTFCAVVEYKGSFTTTGEKSPDGSHETSEGIQGTFQGGYRATIDGEPIPNPEYSTRGNIGTLNPTFNWVAAYFEAGYDFDYEWWGWIYRTGRNGTWVNASTGNQGNIAD
jgi:hypothetical protein